MNDALYVLAATVAAGAVTFLIRAMPFLASRWLQAHRAVQRLGRFLPPAIMTLLLVHSIRDLASGGPTSYLPPILAVALVLVLQWRWHQPLASIAAGTAAYIAWLHMAL